MRISDWSSDVCSSDLPGHVESGAVARAEEAAFPVRVEWLRHQLGLEQRYAAQMGADADQHQNFGLDRTVFVLRVGGLLLDIFRLRIAQALILFGQVFKLFRCAPDHPYRLAAPL